MKCRSPLHSMGCAEFRIWGVAFHRQYWKEILSFSGELITKCECTECAGLVTCHAGTGGGGNRGLGLLILNLGARWGWVVNTTARPFYPQQRAPVPIVQGLRGPQDRRGRVWRIQNFLPRRSSNPEPSTRSDSPYRPPAVCVCVCVTNLTYGTVTWHFANYLYIGLFGALCNHFLQIISRLIFVTDVKCFLRVRHCIWRGFLWVRRFVHFEIAA
jgi:hypothetical protein